VGGSVFDHSCEPTASVVYRGKEMIVRNIREGFDQDFSAVRISYINVINTNQVRKKDLMVMRSFLKCVVQRHCPK
jgi:hypothetical protein